MGNCAEDDRPSQREGGNSALLSHTPKPQQQKGEKQQNAVWTTDSKPVGRHVVCRDVIESYETRRFDFSNVVVTYVDVLRQLRHAVDLQISDRNLRHEAQTWYGSLRHKHMMN